MCPLGKWWKWCSAAAAARDGEHLLRNDHKLHPGGMMVLKVAAPLYYISFFFFFFLRQRHFSFYLTVRSEERQKMAREHSEFSLLSG